MDPSLSRGGIHRIPLFFSCFILVSTHPRPLEKGGKGGTVGSNGKETFYDPNTLLQAFFRRTKGKIPTDATLRRFWGFRSIPTSFQRVGGGKGGMDG